VEPPPVTRLWKRYWFACPHCGFHKFSADAIVRPRRTQPVIVYCFRCPNCGRYSALANPVAVLCATWAVPITLFVIMYWYFAPLGWLVLVPAAILGILNWYVGGPLVTRLLNRYVPLDSAGL
jgi:hypothetical protein